jgi:hypothetical protein
MPCEFDPKRIYYPTNPAALVCEYYGINWEDVCALGWYVDYETTISHHLGNAHISIYRMPSGSYELTHYKG